MAKGSILNHPESVVVPDEDLKANVRKALAWHFWIPRDRIRFEIQDGVVHLSGKVEWLFQKTGVQDAVASVAGVRQIINGLVVEQREPERYYPHPDR